MQKRRMLHMLNIYLFLFTKIQMDTAIKIHYAKKRDTGHQITDYIKAIYTIRIYIYKK